VAMPGNGLQVVASHERAADAVRRRDYSVARGFASPWPWAVLTFALVASAGWPKTPPLIADSLAYRAMALGQFGNIGASITGRVLHPFFVHFVSRAAGLNIDQAFLAVALVTLALMIVTLAWILGYITGIGALVLPLLLTPVLVDDMFGLYYCQDLFYAALLSCFFVALIKGRTVLALILLFALYLARESTILLAFAWAVIAWFESDFFVVAACAALTFVGLFITRKFAALGLPNVHHTNEFVFLALKPPFDSLRNFFGIVLVPSEMRGKPGYSCTPFAIVHLPRLLSYGSTREFGICRFDPAGPLLTFTLWLSLFGIGPAVLWSLFKRTGRCMLVDSPQWLKLATIYGLLYFLIAPAVSEWLERDIGYGWPLFWIAVPALFLQYYPIVPPALVTGLILENLAACWIPYALIVRSGYQVSYLATALGVALAMQVSAAWTLIGYHHQGNVCGHVQ